MVLINLSSCSLFYTTQDTPRRVDAIPLFGVKIDKSSTHGAFCVMESSFDLYVGKKYNRWTVLQLAGKNNRNEMKALVKCECGTERVLVIAAVRGGYSKSCGCLKKEIKKSELTIHGLENHPIYVAWKDMKRRCYNENYRFYHRYGGRGIEVCQEWKDSPKAFFDWSINNGWKNGLTIDRENNDGNYEPNNCRWITIQKQQRNRGDNVLITYNGETKCMNQWSIQYGISNTKVRRALKNKTPLENIFVNN